MKNSIIPITLLAVSITVEAQTISLEQAQELAIQQYPSIRAARLNTQSMQALRSSAFDLGETEISTGGEEIGHGNEAKYTLVAVRQDFNILNIGAQKRYLNQQARVAEAEEQLVERELRREVGIDYASTIVAHQRLLLFQRLDSVYRDFERAAQLRYETEATSRLEYLSAQNQCRQNALALQQAEQDERIALQNLNRWLGEGANYKPEMYAAVSSINLLSSSIEAHPALLSAQEKVKLTERQVKAEKADYLPKLFVQGGTQKIGTRTGYWSYEAGISLPLFSLARSAKARAGKLQQEAAIAQEEQQRTELLNQHQQLVINDEKWSSLLDYYTQDALALANEQEKAAILSYREGAIDYLGFIQNMKDAVKIQLDYWDTYGEYITNRMNLLYY